MLLIDLEKPKQEIILTLFPAQYLKALILKKDDDLQDVIIVLNEDLSNFPERFSKFEINNDRFQGLRPGYYSYRIKDHDNNTIEAGKLLIKGAEPEPGLSLDIQDDYKIYDKNE